MMNWVLSDPQSHEAGCVLHHPQEVTHRDQACTSPTVTSKLCKEVAQISHPDCTNDLMGSSLKLVGRQRGYLYLVVR